MRKGQRGKKVAPPPNRLALSPKDRLRQQAYTLRNARDFAGAKPLLAQLFELEPTNMPLALDYGEALMETEDFAGAVSLYAKLIEADPKNLAAVTNLGGALIRQGKLSDARSILEYALELDPKSIHARINLGSVLQASGERKANLDNALEAVQIDPSSSLAFNNLGSAFSDMAMFKEARHAYETAVMLDPDQIDALINLAAVEARLGASKASAEMYERVIKMLPKEAEQRIEAAKFYAAFEYLKQGNLEKGWDYYEGGFSPLVPASGARSPRRTFDVPRWDGQPLNGKTLLVWREQGLGDELLFYTCLHELKDMGGKVIVECDKRLVEVMARSFPELTIRAEIFLPRQEGRSPFTDFDFHLPAGSLMRYFRPTVESFRRSQPFVAVDQMKVTKFRERLGSYETTHSLVGICWRSGKLDPVRNLSYTNLDEWSYVLKSPKVKFVNLQYGDCEEEISSIEKKYQIDIIRWKDLDLKNDLDDVYALMSCLDVVVSVQTAVLTMAGTLGKRTIGLKAGGWTRLGNSRFSPWFKNTCFEKDPNNTIQRWVDWEFEDKLPKFIHEIKLNLDNETAHEGRGTYQANLERLVESVYNSNGHTKQGPFWAVSFLKFIIKAVDQWNYKLASKEIQNKIASLEEKYYENEVFQSVMSDIILTKSLVHLNCLKWESATKTYNTHKTNYKIKHNTRLIKYLWTLFLYDRHDDLRDALGDLDVALNTNKQEDAQIASILTSLSTASDTKKILETYCEKWGSLQHWYTLISETLINQERYDEAIELFEYEPFKAKKENHDIQNYIYALTKIEGLNKCIEKIKYLYEHNETLTGLYSKLAIYKAESLGLEGMCELIKRAPKRENSDINYQRINFLWEQRDLDHLSTVKILNDAKKDYDASLAITLYSDWMLWNIHNNKSTDTHSVLESINFLTEKEKIPYFDLYLFNMILNIKDNRCDRQSFHQWYGSSYFLKNILQKYYLSNKLLNNEVINQNDSCVEDVGISRYRRSWLDNWILELPST